MYDAESWGALKYGKKPAARLQWSFCNNKLQDLHFVTKLSNVCSRALGSPRIWPEPAARLQWNICNSKLQDLHVVTGQQISRPASYAMYLVCSKELGSPEIWPEPGSASCKALMDFLQQQGAESPSCDWPADIQSIKSCYVCSRKLESQEIWLQGSNGTLATANCRISIFWPASRYPDQQAIIYMQQHAEKHRNTSMARAG